MCQKFGCNPLHTIVEVSELFQEFLKLASVDGFVESWCIEISLQNGAPDYANLSEESMHHFLGLHSFSYVLLKILEEQNHGVNSDSCNCGWEVSHVPEDQHTDIHRYTPGTIIRWSQGECHVLLAPQDYEDTPEESAIDLPADSEGAFKDDGATQEDDEVAATAGLTANTEGSKEILDEPNSSKDSSESKHLEIEKNQSFPPMINQSLDTVAGMKDDKDLKVEEDTALDHNATSSTEADDKDTMPGISLSPKNDNLPTDDEDNKSNFPFSQLKHQKSDISDTNLLNTNLDFFKENSYASRESDDENSCMLVINEDGDENSQEEKTSDNLHEQSSSQNVSPSHMRSNPGTNEDDDEDDDNESETDDDDTSSVSSTSSSSSSSTSSSSSSSSDDDDRINFKKRVEQAAQAARAAAASAAVIRKDEEALAAITSYSHTNFGQTTTDNHQNVGFSKNSELLTISLQALNKDDNQMGESFSTTSVGGPSTSPTLSFQRDPDDLQAAQGLAALGKSQGFAMLEQKTKDTHKWGMSKAIKHLLGFQGPNFEVLRVDRKSFQCYICGKIFQRLFKLLEHQASHGNEKPWQCEECDRKFANLHVLQRHRAAKHLQQFSCCICHKSFGNQSVLQTHLATHASNKPYPCSICCQTFALKVTRDTHEAQHTGNRPWSCNACGKSYITKYKLKAHMKGHTGELYCSICDRQFASQDVLTRHKKRHQNLTSSGDLGGAKSLASSLKAKLVPSRRGRNTRRRGQSTSPLTASNSNTFRCQMCNKVFGKSADLTHHLASCSAIVYCSPVSVQAVSSPILSQNDLLNHPQQSIALLTNQIIPSTQQLSLPPQPLTVSLTPHGCMMENKKMGQYAPCEPSNAVPHSLVDLDQRSYIINTLPNESLASLSPFQQHGVIPTPGAVIQQTLNPQSSAEGSGVSLPDYLKEVDFGDSFQSVQGQG